MGELMVQPVPLARRSIRKGPLLTTALVFVKGLVAPFRAPPQAVTRATTENKKIVLSCIPALSWPRLLQRKKSILFTLRRACQTGPRLHRSRAERDAGQADLNWAVID